jgi:uncharacterized protein (DUF1684 family)
MPTLNAHLLEEALALLDWKRRVFALYADARTDPLPRRSWHRWITERDRLFREHPQTPLDADAQASFSGLAYYPYDPAARVVGAVEPEPGELQQLATSGQGPIGFYRIGRVTFSLARAENSLPLYWLDAYGGGIFLPFTDATSGVETYGGGRYLLDTVKGADLGTTDGGLNLDFNYAYNPSCSYNPRWNCPLAPAENRLSLPVRAGERERP